MFFLQNKETISHLFYYCTHIKDIWNQVQIYFTDCLHFSQLKPQTAIFRFHNIDNDTSQISIIKYLKIRRAVNNRNKCERFRKTRHKIEHNRK